MPDDEPAKPGEMVVGNDNRRHVVPQCGGGDVVTGARGGEIRDSEMVALRNDPNVPRDTK